MKNLLLQLKVWKDQRGQDLIEYALMAGFVAVAAGAIMPGVATSISSDLFEGCVGSQRSQRQLIITFLPYGEWAGVPVSSPKVFPAGAVPLL